MKERGEVNKQISHCKDIYTAMMSTPVPLFEELINDAYQSEHIKQAESRASKILDANYEKANLEAVCAAVDTLSESEQQQLLSLLKKFEHLFDGSLGDFETSPVHLDLKEGAKPYHGKAFPVPHIHKETLKREIERLVSLGVLRKCSDSEWGAPTFIIPKKKWYSEVYF